MHLMTTENNYFLPKPKNPLTGLFIALLGTLFLHSCEYLPLGDAEEDPCRPSEKTLISYEQLFAKWTGDLVIIQEDEILEGFVISSDQYGNFFNELLVQSQANSAPYGLRIRIETSDSHALYPLGSKVEINLKDLALDYVGDEWRLGAVQSFFGNNSVSPIPYNRLDESIKQSCGDFPEVFATAITVEEFKNSPVNTLVSLNGVQFAEAELGKLLAVPEEESIRQMQSCEGLSFELLTSGYADFQTTEVPESRGKITGVVVLNGTKKSLKIRLPEDLDMTEERCSKSGPEVTENDSILISELADPDNNSGARFIELYNAGSTAVVLDNWKLQRYTNASTTVGSETDLGGIRIEAKSCLVIAANREVFLDVYGFEPDLQASGSSVANSNGDDNILLLGPEDTIVDIFGRVGEDGSGTDHEFEDGRALRKASISNGKADYLFTDWFLWNDTGEAGTQNQIQNAPGDFSPGVHPDPQDKM